MLFHENITVEKIIMVVNTQHSLCKIKCHLFFYNFGLKFMTVLVNYDWNMNIKYDQYPFLTGWVRFTQYINIFAQFCLSVSLSAC